MMVVMPVAVALLMPVVFAAVRLPRQLAIQIGGHQRRDGRTRNTGAHREALLREEGQRPATNAAGNDNLNPLFAEPAREGAGPVFRRGQDCGVEHCLFLRVHLDQGKFVAAAEVTVKAAMFNREGDFHGWLAGLVLGTS